MPAEFENGMKFLRLGAVFTRYQHKSLKLKIVHVNAVAAISIISAPAKTFYTKECLITEYLIS